MFVMSHYVSLLNAMHVSLRSSNVHMPVCLYEYYYALRARSVALPRAATPAKFAIMIEFESPQKDACSTALFRKIFARRGCENPAKTRNCSDQYCKTRKSSRRGHTPLPTSHYAASTLSLTLGGLLGTCQNQLPVARRPKRTIIQNGLHPIEATLVATLTKARDEGLQA